MATYRYWRLSGLTVPSAYLEIGEFQFIQANSLLASGATLTSALALWGGTVQSFNDGNPSTACSWTQATAQDPAFAVVWDFGAPKDVVGCQFYGYDNNSRFPSVFTVHASTDSSTWDLQGTFTATYPGNFTATSPFLWGVIVWPGPMLLGDMLQLVARTPTDFSQPQATSVPDMQQAAKPLAFGPGRISGTLKVLTLPAAREVRLHDRLTGQLLRKTVSAPNGAYAFNSLQLGRKYLVIGLDDTGQAVMHNAAVADMLEAGA